MRAQNVSNDELLVDIANTEKELKAYQDIASGYDVLAQMPEVQGNNRAIIGMARQYKAQAAECQTFLKKLYEIRQERGLR